MQDKEFRMSKITVVTAANKKYEKYLKYTKESSNSFGYDCLIYDLGGLGYGKKFEGRFSDVANAKIPCKPSIIKDAMSSINDGDYLVWMDADALLVDSIDCIAQDYDVGVTLRSPRHMIKHIPLNAGVIFFRKNDRTLKFIEKWDLICKKAESDQVILNYLIPVSSGCEQKVLNIDDFLVKVFTCEEYNNYYFDENQRAAKIKHYKTSLRNLHPADKK